MAIDLKELKFYVNYTGKKLKTDGLTLNQNSSNNVIDFICMDQYDVVEIYFKNPAGQISPKYHMINNGIYQKSTDDLEVSEIADNTFHEWKFAIPYAITSFTMTSSTARMEVSFAGYKYDAGNKLVISSTANTQIVVNKSNTSDSLDESYNGTDVENLWKAIGTISEGKQDKLPTVINGRYLHTNENTGELEWSIVQSGGLTEVVWGEINGDIDSQTDLANALAGKQNVIADLSTIRSNASKGATAVQPGDLATVATSGSYNDLSNKPTIPTNTNQLTNGAGFITNTVNNLVNYYTKSETYTKDEINSLISGGQPLEFVIYNGPITDITASASTYGKIYLVPDTTPDAAQKQTKLEYITLRTGTEGSYVYSWELLGNTDIDISNYYTKTQIDGFNTSMNNAIAGKQNAFSLGSNGNLYWSNNNTVLNAIDTTYSSTQGIEQTGTTFKLREDFYNYLITHAYEHPQIETFQLIDGNDNVISASQTTGDTVTVVKVRHGESHLSNIQGTLTLKQDGVNIVTGITPNTYTEITLSSPITISSDSTFSLSGTDTMGQTFSNAVSIQFSAPQVAHPAYAFATNTTVGNTITYNNTFQKINDFELVSTSSTAGLSNNHFEFVGGTNMFNGYAPYILCENHGTGIELLTYDNISRFQPEDSGISPREVTFIDENNNTLSMWLYASTEFEAVETGEHYYYTVGGAF